MATPNALAQGLQGYNFMLTPQANVQLRNIAQEQALAQSLREEGMKPIDTSNRQIGGVGYAISPMEGAAKIAQSLVGAYGNYDANNQYNKLFNPQPDGSNQQDVPSDAAASSGSSGGTMPGTGGYPALPVSDGAPAGAQGGMAAFSPDFMNTLQAIKQKYNLSDMEALQILQDPTALARVVSANAPTGEMKNAQFAYGPQGAQSAVADVLNLQRNPGARSYQEGLGTAAAGMAPAGTMPGGIGGGVQAVPLPPPPGVAGSPVAASPQGMRVTDGGIMLDGPAPPLNAVRNAAVQAATNAGAVPGAAPLAPADAGSGVLAAINPAGMTNEQYKAAVAAQQAGATARAAEEGTNLGKAEQGAASIDSRIGTAKNTLQHIIDLAPNVSSGMGIGTKEDFANQFNGKLAANNADFTNASARLFLQELPAVMSSLSNRGNQFMERQIQEAGSIDMNMHPDAKVRVAQRLLTALDQAKDMQDQSVTLQGGTPRATVHWVMGPNGQLVRQ